MKLTVRQAAAVRKFVTFRPRFLHIWRSERLLMRTVGIHRVTLESLERLGIVERAVWNNEGEDERVFRLTPLAICIIRAVRGDA